MMHVRIKICGITESEGVDASVEAGADALGFVFAESPRRMTPSAVIPLLSRIPAFVTTVAVFRYPDLTELESVMSRIRLDLIQVEPSPRILEIARARDWRILPVIHDEPDLDNSLRLTEDDKAVLLEGSGSGGRGVRPNWERAASLARSRPLVLAGGLTPLNVGDAIRQVRPWAVDVSSGVETSPGIKDPEGIRAFVRAVRETEQQVHSAQESLT